MAYVLQASRIMGVMVCRTPHFDDLNVRVSVYNITFLFILIIMLLCARAWEQENMYTYIDINTWLLDKEKQAEGEDRNSIYSYFSDKKLKSVGKRDLP